MNKVLTLAFILFLPLSLISQIQVSNIEYFQKTTGQSRKGFIPIGDDEYFIEQGRAETRISLIKEDELELIHVITDRPLGVTYNPNQFHHYQNSNSGLLYDGEILYEIYPSYVYAINILTGEVDQILDISNSNIFIIFSFTVTADHYYFAGIENGQYSFYEYDRQQATVMPVEISQNNFFNVLGTRLYLYDQNYTQVVSYDLMTEAQDTILTASSGQFLIKQLILNGEPQILLTESDSSSLFLIDHEHNLTELTCLENVKPEEIYLMSDLVLFTKENNDSIYVMDRNNCSLITSYLLPSKLPFRDSRELYDEYVLLSNTSNWLGLATFFIYDVAEKTFTRLDIPADFPYTDRAIRYDNKLYLITPDNIHHVGVVPQIMEVDLDTKLVRYIDDYDREKIYSIVIGEHQNDETFHIYYYREEETTLQRYNHNEQELTQIHEFNDLKNVGIIYGLYENTWHNDNLFFYCQNALYVLEDDQVTKIIETDSYFNNSTPTFGSSGFVKKGGNLHALLPQDSAVYKMTVDLENFSYQKQAIPGMDYIDYRRPATEHAIVNIPNGYSVDNTGYYDIEDEQFKPFKYNGANINTSRFTLSGNNLLLQRTGPIDQWILFNTETETSILTEIPDGEYPAAYPDGEGGFYLTPWRFTNGVLPDLMHMDTDGKISSITPDFNYSVFYGGERLDGEVKSIAFDGDGEMIIFSAKGGEYHLTTIPDDDLVYYQEDSYFWRETDERSVLEVPNASKYDTYIFSFGTTPIKITPDGRTERLVEAWIEEEKVVLLYVDRFSNTLSFVDYEFATGNTIVRQSIIISQSMSINRSYFEHHINHAPNKYLLTLDDTMHGLEPWLYNSNTGSLTLVKDMREGLADSRPTQYLLSTNGTDVYFIASSDNDGRQLFKLDQTVGTPSIEIVSAPLIVSPSPSTGLISLSQNLKNLQVYNLNGQVLYNTNHYSKNDPLNLSPLVNGLYYVVATTEEGKFCREKFIINKD